MRTTKTLLIAAAALAATVTASKAQTVYSQNVVGYVNVTAAPGAFTLLANQLDLGPGSNSVNNVLGGSSGVVSSSSQLYIWTGTGFEDLYYYNASDASPDPAGWYLGATLVTNTLAPGQAEFFINGQSTNITLTLVGQVDQGSNSWGTVQSGINFYSEPQPLAGTPLDSTNVNFPAVSSADYYQAWTGTGYGPVLYYYNASDASPDPAGWYQGATWEDTNAAAWPNVGQGFLIEHPGAPVTWTNVFEVQ